MTTTLSDVMYMQDLTPVICKNSKENDTKQLIDERDGKIYWVTKLKDDNCWMTQNLDYDDPNSVRIEDPDIWDNGPVVTSNKANTNFNYRAYYDPGAVIANNNTLEKHKSKSVKWRLHVK